MKGITKEKQNLILDILANLNVPVQTYLTIKTIIDESPTIKENEEDKSPKN